MTVAAMEVAHGSPLPASRDMTPVRPGDLDHPYNVS